MNGLTLDVRELDATFFSDMTTVKSCFSTAKSLISDFVSSCPSDFTAKGAATSCVSKVNEAETMTIEAESAVNAKLQRVQEIEKNVSESLRSTTIEKEWNADSEANVFKRSLATAGNLGIGFISGVLSFGESLLDTAATVVGGATSLVSGIVGFGNSLFAGEDLKEAGESFKSSFDKVWKGTKAIVSTNAVGWLSDKFYNGIGKGLEENAYSWAKRDGIGYQVSQGLGYMAGVVLTGGVASGAALGSAATAGATAFVTATTAGVAGFGKYTAEEWNKNTININGSNGSGSLNVDYNKFREIENLSAGEATTLSQTYYDETGQKQTVQYSVTSNGDGTYAMTDAYGNNYTIDKDGGMVESNDLKGIGYGAIRGAWEGIQYGIGMKINGAGFKAITGNIANPVLQKLVTSGMRVTLDSATGAAEVPFQTVVDAVFHGKDLSTAWDDAGGWRAVGSQTLIAGIGSTIGETGAVQKTGAYIGEKMHSLWDSISKPKIETGPASGLSRGKIGAAVDDVVGGTNPSRTSSVADATSAKPAADVDAGVKVSPDSGTSPVTSHKTFKDRLNSLVDKIKGKPKEGTAAQLKGDLADGSPSTHASPADVDGGAGLTPKGTAVDVDDTVVAAAAGGGAASAATMSKMSDAVVEANARTIDDAVSRIDKANPGTSSKGMDSLRKYAETGDIKEISRVDGARDMVENVGQNGVKRYLIDKDIDAAKADLDIANSKVKSAELDMDAAKKQFLAERQAGNTGQDALDKLYNKLDKAQSARNEANLEVNKANAKINELEAKKLEVAAAGSGAASAATMSKMSGAVVEANARTIDDALSRIDKANPGTSNKGMDSLRKYAETGDIKEISRVDGARDMVDNVGQDGVKRYLIDKDIDAAKADLDIANSKVKSAELDIDAAKKHFLAERKAGGTGEDAFGKLKKAQSARNEANLEVNKANAKINELEAKRNELDGLGNKPVSPKPEELGGSSAKPKSDGTAEKVKIDERLDKAQQRYDEARSRYDKASSKYNEEMDAYIKRGKTGEKPSTDQLNATYRELEEAGDALNIEKGRSFREQHPATVDENVEPTKLSKGDRERVIDMVQRKDIINETLSPDDNDNIEAIITMINNKHGDNEAGIKALKEYLAGKDMPRANDAYGMNTRATDSVADRMSKWDTPEQARAKIEAYVKDYDLKNVADKAEVKIYEDRAAVNTERMNKFNESRLKAGEHKPGFMEKSAERRIKSSRDLLDRSVDEYDNALKKYNDSVEAFRNGKGTEMNRNLAYEELSTARDNVVKNAKLAEQIDPSLKGLSKEIPDIGPTKADVDIRKVVTEKYTPLDEAVTKAVDFDNKMILKRGIESSDDDFSKIEVLSSDKFINEDVVNSINANDANAVTDIETNIDTKTNPDVSETVTPVDDSVDNTDVKVPDNSGSTDDSSYIGDDYVNNGSYGSGGSGSNDTTNVPDTATDNTTDTSETNNNTITDNTSSNNTGYNNNYNNNNSNNYGDVNDAGYDYMDDDSMNFDDSDLPDMPTNDVINDTPPTTSKNNNGNKKPDLVMEDNSSNIWGSVLSGAAAIGGAAIIGKVSHDAIKDKKDKESGYSNYKENDNKNDKYEDETDLDM